MKFASPEDVRAMSQMLVHAGRKFRAIDGEQRAAASAYYAFFSLLPMVVWLLAIGSWIADQDTVARGIINFLDDYIPMNPETKSYVFTTITDLIRMRARLGAAASVVLVWCAVQFFKALIRATNRAWGAEVYSWWRLRLKSLLLLSMAVAIAVLASASAVLGQAFWPACSCRRCRRPKRGPG